MANELINGRPVERILYNGKYVEAQYIKDFTPFQTELVNQNDTSIAFSRWDANDVDPVTIKMTINSVATGNVAIGNNVVSLSGAVELQGSAEYEAYDLWENRYVANYVKLYKPME